MELSPGAARILDGLLQARTGQQLEAARRRRAATVLQPLARELGMASIDRLVGEAAAAHRPALAQRVVEALLNNETFFFRDRAVFDLLLGPVLDRFERSRAGRRRLSIWCAGCSTGQEAWSLAMHFAERPLRWKGWTIDILATDVSEAAIAQARDGAYSQFEVQRGLPATQMIRWFEKVGADSWRIVPELRGAVRFERRNLLEPLAGEAPFDIVLCRNVLLYFPAATRLEAFARIAEASADDAVLALGAGEAIAGQSADFAPDPAWRGLYARSPAAAPPLRAAG